MALYQSYTFTTANQWLIDFAEFVAANGWTIDYDGVYNTSYRRVHFHKGTAHFDFYSASATAIVEIGCTGYDSGTTPALQPGAGIISRQNTFGVGVAYMFVSTPGAIYFGNNELSIGAWYWGSIFTVQSKVGNWTDGHGLSQAAAAFFGTNAHTNGNGYAQIYYNGGWSPAQSAAAGCLHGTGVQTELPTKQPNFYNGAIIPFPIILFIYNVTDSTKRHPIGYLPGVYGCCGGDIYSPGDQIIIGSDTYIIMPLGNANIGVATTGDLLFKLGS